MNLDLNKIQYFQVVVAQRSISQAAIHVGLSQPALSLMMKRLEDELGVKLIEKVGRNIRITEFGHVLNEKAGDLQNWIEQLNESISETRLPQGKITIGTYENISAIVLPKFSEMFHKKYPDIDIHIDFSSNEKILDRIKESRYDAGVLALLTPNVVQGLEAEPLFQSEMHLVAAPSLGMPKKIKPSQLAKYPFISILPHLDEDYQDLMETFGAYFSKSRVPIASENLLTVREHVVRGLGYSFIPSHLIQNEVQKGTLQVIETGAKRIPFSAYIVTKRKDHVPGRLKRFREELVAYFERETVQLKERWDKELGRKKE